MWRLTIYSRRGKVLALAVAFGIGIMIAAAADAARPHTSHPMSLQQIDVQPRDMGSNFVALPSYLNTGYLSATATGNWIGIPGTILHSHGWINSYRAIIRNIHHGESDSRIDQFRTSTDAHWDYQRTVGFTVGQGYYPFTLAPIGNERTAYNGHGDPTAFIGVVFREGRYVASIAVDPYNAKTTVLRLARLVDQRIKQHG